MRWAHVYTSAYGLLFYVSMRYIAPQGGVKRQDGRQRLAGRSDAAIKNTIHKDIRVGSLSRRAETESYMGSYFPEHCRKRRID